MRGDQTVIQHLNAVLKNELTAINQYFLHARMLRHWGVTKLGDREYHASLDEMKDADKLLVGENVREVRECDLRLGQAGLARLREAIAHCEGVRDFVSRDLFSDILEGEEEQVDFLETQFELIDRIGLERYILLQSGSAE